MAEQGRKLRDVKAARAIKAFQKAGYRVARVHGSHYVMEHDERPPVQIPRHGTLKLGLLLSMLKRAGLSVEDFEGLM